MMDRGTVTSLVDGMGLAAWYGGAGMMGGGVLGDGRGRRGGALAALVVLMLVGTYGLPLPVGERPAGGPATAQAASLRRAYGGLPLRFEPNVGQAAAPVEYVARGVGYTLLLGPNEAALALRPAADAAGAERPADLARLALASPEAPPTGGAETVLRMQLVGASDGAASGGEAALPGVVHYYLGDDPAAWRTDVPTYGQVRYREVYPGIDLVYYGSGGQLEYDFVVAPGADPARVRLRFPGADTVAVDAQGDLVLSVGGTEVRQRAPVLYQERDGVRQGVAGGYMVLDDPPMGASPSDAAGDVVRALGPERPIGFAVGAYGSHPTVSDRSGAGVLDLPGGQR